MAFERPAPVRRRRTCRAAACPAPPWHSGAGVVRGRGTSTSFSAGFFRWQTSNFPRNPERFADLREGLLALAVGAGLRVMTALMEADATGLAGVRASTTVSGSRCLHGHPRCRWWSRGGFGHPRRDRWNGARRVALDTGVPAARHPIGLITPVQPQGVVRPAQNPPRSWVAWAGARWSRAVREG